MVNPSSINRLRGMYARLFVSYGRAIVQYRYLLRRMEIMNHRIDK